MSGIDENGAPSPSVEDYVRATAEAFGLGPDAAIAHLDQTLAATADARHGAATRHTCTLHGDALTWERGGDDMPTVRGRWRCPTCDVRLMAALDDVIPPAKP